MYHRPDLVGGFTYIYILYRKEGIMQRQIVKNLISIYTAKILDAKTNIDVLMINPTSIPEHSEFTKELDKHITEIATAKEKIAVLEDDLAYLGKDH